MNVFKQCHCKDENGRKLGKRCPKLFRKDGSYNQHHGRWYARYEAPPGPDGRRRQPRLGPFDTHKEAQDALDSAMSNARLYGHAEDHKLTVAEHLDWMLEHHFKPKGEDTHWRAKSAVDLYFKPAFGHERLADLSERHVFDAIAAMRRVNRDEDSPSETLRRILEVRATWHGKRLSTRPLAESTIKRHMAVLVTCLNAKSARKVLPVNPAAGIEYNFTLEKPRLWTPERVARWEATGEVPGDVMVWTQAMAGQFLDHPEVCADRLYALWHLAVYWGQRRSELVNMQRPDVRTDLRRVGVPDSKTDSGVRSFTVDEGTSDVLEAWFERQMVEQMAAGEAWVDSGHVFTYEDGRVLRREYVTKRFNKLRAKTGLPPVRFHDLRHGAAAYLIHAMGGAKNPAALKTVQEIIGHASAAFTSDVYAVVLEEMEEKAAEVAAAMIPRAAR